MGMATAVVSQVEIRAKQRIPTLDGWRGVGILLVLIGHFTLPAYPDEALWIARIGQHGVAIFFVLSGFLITTLLREERSLHGTIDLRRFYLRRFFRLMPCAWCYLATISLIALGSGVMFLSTKEMLGSVFFFRNFVDLVGAHMLTAHFWSLSIEEQFYLLWPGLLLFLGDRRARWFAIFVSVLIASWRFQHWGLVARHGFMYSGMTQYRADALLVGCAMALALPRLKRYLRAWMALPLLSGLGACAYLYADMIPLHESVIVSLLLAVTTQFPDTSRILEWRPLALLGKASYSLYVWQQIFWVGANRGSSVSMLIALCLLAAVATASYALIERPAIRFERRLEAMFSY
jgi:peptidoglycan/LPS O-acetylase OafA/YrhL